MQIYIRQNNEEFGPYTREMVLEYVKRGIFNAPDLACYAGTSEWKTVGEILGITAASRPGRTPDLSPSGKITEFNPAWTAPPAASRSRPGAGKRGFMIAVNVILVSTAAAVAYLRLSGRQSQVRSFIASVSADMAKPANTPPVAASSAAPVVPVPASPKLAATPSSAPAAVTTPVPSMAASTAAPPPASTPAMETTPAPAVATTPPELTAPSTPAPAPAPPPGPPKPFDPADLASNPAAWPKTLHLKQPVVFPALLNSQVVGSLTVPAGTVVKLVNIQGDQLTLDFQGGTRTVSWRLTDIEEQVAKSSSGSSAASPHAGAADGLVAPPR